ncbi:gamma-glutamyltransferase family protein [Alphaproteobacteria bacterium]|nr:gamma-glutamyltransferase family protein [Alphaproteobacteria bacterium]
MFKFNKRSFSSLGNSNVLSSQAMIASSHPIASSVGIDILKSGGNAVDAALAMNAVLCIAEPHMTGIGGDCFALLSIDGSTNIKALNGSGKSSENTNVSNLRKKNINEITTAMPDAITIPGAVAGWSLLHKEHGHIPWKELFVHAINFAEKGIKVHERVALDWSNNADKLTLDSDTAKFFLNNWDAYKFTDNFKNINLSNTFKTIAVEGMSGFYHGWVADDMVNKLNSIGGCHTLNDFRNASAEWVEPIAANYRKMKIHECPPNGQGLVALIILSILEKFDFNSMSKSDYAHIFCEATKIGYYLRDQYLSDPEFNMLSVNHFLKSKILDEYASKIDISTAKTYKKSDFPDHPDTIYLTVRDKNGMTISFINSLFDAFGSGITAPKSGILFHSRGRAFNLIEGHPNQLNSNKRPLHTIIPAMVSYNGEIVGSFGVMGGQYQAAGHAYVLSQMIDFGLNPQEALNMPRLFPNNNIIDIENDFDKDVINQLVSRGHKINYPAQIIGGGQMIFVDSNKKLLIGASDWRKDGCAIGY